MENYIRFGDGGRWDVRSEMLISEKFNRLSNESLFSFLSSSDSELITITDDSDGDEYDSLLPVLAFLATPVISVAPLRALVNEDGCVDSIRIGIYWKEFNSCGICWIELRSGPCCWVLDECDNV